MKRRALLALLLFLATALSAQSAFTGDLVLAPGNVRFSTGSFLEGKPVRIYATVTNGGSEDMRGVVRFYDSSGLIQGDQPISVLAGREDSVFVDWVPSPGDETIRIVAVPLEKELDNPANNTIEKKITVFADTDRDGIANKDDPDDDNDGTSDAEDSFPFNKAEQLDTDGDRIGNNEDNDDDNDGIKDSEDGVPLNANETVDTDKDGIGNNEDTDDDGDGVSDLDEVRMNTDPAKTDSDGDKVNDGEDAYPTDPTQARDFDRDGTADEKDNDADNDGIPKNSDVNDTNLGPKIAVTSEDQSPRRVIMPGETFILETKTSKDPDGKIETTKWNVEGKEIAGSKLAYSFTASGFKKVGVTVTDDKGESRATTLTILVIPPYVPWLLVTILLLGSILAIFFVFSYSKRRAKKRRA